MSFLEGFAFFVFLSDFAFAAFLADFAFFALAFLGESLVLGSACRRRERVWRGFV